MDMSENNTVDVYTRSDGKYGWRIWAKGTPESAVPDQIIATDGGQGYEHKDDCLAGLFRVFFGAYDMSFLEAHQEWAEHNKHVTEDESPDPWIARQTTCAPVMDEEPRDQRARDGQGDALEMPKDFI